MEQNTICQARLKNCTLKATEVHHMQGRLGDLLTDESNFLAVCRNCHQEIELNPAMAKEKQFSNSRLNVGEQTTESVR